MAGIRKLTDSSLPKRQAFDYDANNNLIYIGKATVGTAESAALWQIKKLTYDANYNLTDIAYANGLETYESIWNDRVSYSYS